MNGKAKDKAGEVRAKAARLCRARVQELAEPFGRDQEVQFVKGRDAQDYVLRRKSVVAAPVQAHAPRQVRDPDAGECNQQNGNLFFSGMGDWLAVVTTTGALPACPCGGPACRFHAGRHPYARFTGAIFTKDIANMQC